jgi:hypothetical protein
MVTVQEEIHEIIVGLFSLTIGSALSAALATWVMNGGYTSIYYDCGKHGLLWSLLELPIVFVCTVWRALYPIALPYVYFRTM